MLCRNCAEPCLERRGRPGRRKVFCSPRCRERFNKSILAGVIQSAKAVPCMDCGQRYPAYVMDLDHRPGEEKLFILGNRGNRNVGKVRAEIAKCDPVCANCHRERTWNRSQPKEVV